MAAVSGVLFFWRMLTRPDPLVDLRAFRNLNFAAGSLFSFIVGIGLYGAVYVVPLFLSRVRGYDSLQIAGEIIRGQPVIPRQAIDRQAVVAAGGLAPNHRAVLGDVGVSAIARTTGYI